MKSSSSNSSDGKPSSSSSSEYWIRTGKQLTASAISGWTEALLTYPAEYTKVMLQLQTNGKTSIENGQQQQQPKKLISASDVVRSTLRQYGPLGLYRGFSIVFVGNVPKYMCRFGAYEQIKSLLAGSDGKLTSGQKLLCGLGAGVTEALVAVIPIESTKVKFINDRLSPSPKYRGLASGVKEIVRERGLGAMYSGVTATVVKQASNQAVRFAVFESLKEWSGSSKVDYDDHLSTKKLYPLFGMAAGATSVLVNAPIDAVKTRLQSLQASKYSGTVDCIRKVYQEEGLPAFYRGSLVRMFKCGAEVAIAFTTYNLIIDLIGT